VLRELRIENLLLIERAELRLGEGLNAITGETGAGKTILAHSLDLLMGGRARAQIVRPGAEEAWVEGVFDLPPALLADPELAELAERLPEGAEEIVLGRRVAVTGRTTAFVAGRAASVTDLKLLGGRLLAFYGQHEHRKLTISSAQAEVLDGFAGGKHLESRRRYREAHCTSGTAPGSVTSTSAATSCRRSRRSRPIPRRRRSCRLSGSGCDT
jgi:DNA repair protein RecN (Recombination protein N)